MIKQNLAIKSLKFVFKDIVFDLAYWFFWWYTTGLKKAFLRMLDTINQANDELGLLIWIKNIFIPMYGQRDVQSRIISFVMRIAMIFFRSIAFFFWLMFAAILFLFWIIVPVFIIFQILYNTGIWGKLW